MFENLIKYGKTHAPGILTAVSIISGLGTTIYSFWAGWRCKEIHDEMPKDATPGYKAKRYIPVVAPIIVGSTVSTLSCYSAHKIHTRRYLALAGTLALTQKDNENLRAMKDKMKEKLGIEESEKARKEVAEVSAINTAGMLGVDRNRMIYLYDGVRGQVIHTTILAFENVRSRFNDNCENGQRTMVEFLEELAKENNEEYEFHEIDEDIIFGLDTMTPIFNPTFSKNEAKVMDDLTAMPVFRYKYSSPYEFEEHRIGKKLYSDLGIDLSQ